MSLSTVTATVQDPSGQVFANGTWQLIFKPNAFAPGIPVDGGAPVTNRIFGGSLDASGSFSQANVNRNDTINPTGSKWTLIVAPNASGQAYQVDLVVNSANFNATAIINAVITNITIAVMGLPHAYQDSEVGIPPASGGIYYNVTSKFIKVWDVATQTWITATATVSAPGGTGFTHNTAGVQDGASKLVNLTASTDVAANQGTATTLLHGNAAGQPAFSGVSLTADTNANQGSTTTVLHGNAAGQPSFGQVNLSTDVTGTLPAASVAAPTGTGFTHITAGVQDGASKTVDVSSTDITGVLKSTAFPALSGDVTTVAGALATTLATVATPGTGTKATVNAKGLVTAVANASLASADFANQGTTTTVLHGNAAGNPSFGAVTSADFPTAVVNNATNTFTGTGTIDLSAGGTTAFRIPVSTPLNPTVAGNIVFDSAGGQGYKAGFSGSTDLFAFLTQTQTLTNKTLTSPAITNPTTTGTDSGTQTLSGKRFTPRIVTLSTGTTFTPDGDNSDETVMNMTGVAGTITIAAPSGTPTDGQKLILRLKTTNIQNYSFNATYRFSTTVTAPTATTATKTDYIGCIWNALDTKWDVVAVDQGH